MPPPLLALQDIRLSHGGAPLLDGAALAVGAGDRLALVGRNGSGKSTLLRVAAGDQAADAGKRFVQPGTTMRYLPQEPDLSGYADTLGYVLAGMDADGVEHGGDEYRARYLLERLGLTGSEEPGRLSGGEARRAALARVLAPEPDILLLDEPTNHLDLPAIEWLQAELAGMRCGLVLISHDRRLLGEVSRGMVWLDRGTTRQLGRGFAHFEEWRDEVLEEEARAHHKLGRKIAAEEDWLRYGVTARRKRNVKRLADLHTLRRKRKEATHPVGGLRMEGGGAAISGKQVVVAEGVEKGFGGRLVVRALDATVLRGDRLGIVGPNGAGKTTLLRLLTGELAPDAGTVQRGTGLEMVVLDQRRANLDGELTLADTLTGSGGDTVRTQGEGRHVAGFMKDWLFAPGQARMKVAMLSGGERGRVLLARAFAAGGNLLVLDEPTNDLDLETLEVLQERLAEFAGTVLLVSHDRDFLDRVATAVLAYEGDGRWQLYAGGYSDMLAQRGADLAPRSDREAREAGEIGTVKVAGVQAAPRGKLSFKEQHALRTLPERIAGLEAEIAELKGMLANPALYAANRVRFAAMTENLAEREAALVSAEEAWLEVELRREALGQKS